MNRQNVASILELYSLEYTVSSVIQVHSFLDKNVINFSSFPEIVAWLQGQHLTQWLLSAMINII